MIRKNRGITLIALVITIIVLLILAGVTIATVFGEDGLISKAQQAKEKTEEATRKEEGLLSNLEGQIDEALTSEFNKEKGVNRPKLSKGMIPIKDNGSSWVITSEEDPEWYDYQNKKWANIMLSDGTYKEGASVGTVVADNQLGSMFVWVPRYSYSIKEYAVPKNNEGIDDPIMEVTFLVGGSNTDQAGNTYNLDYDLDKVKKGEATPKIVHPGFSFDGKNTTGMWVAKIEASMAETNNNTVANNNVTNKTVKVLPNAESWRYITIGNCLTNCLAMNQEGNGYGIEKESTDSHLIKDSEWGAVAYLAASQYGIVPTINNTGNSYTEDGVKKYHAYTGGKDYKTNVKQSTTGNITGVYDLNGGAWDYVAAYYSNENAALNYYGTSTFFENNKVKEEYRKYWDIYEVSQKEKEEMAEGLYNKDASANLIRKEITQDRFNLMKSKKGIGMNEVTQNYSYYGKMINGSYTWLLDADASSIQYGESYYSNDYVLIGNTEFPFLRRGGGWDNGSYGGIFSSGARNGGGNIYFGFRPILTIE